MFLIRFVKVLQKNKLLFLGLVCNMIFYNLNAQIGINTEVPKSTLDIVGKSSDPLIVDGLLIPRVTLGQLISKNSNYGEPQAGTLIYVSYVGDGTPSGKTEDILNYGFYYYDYWNSKGQKWKRINDTDIRRSSVTVGSGKMYETLQDAFNTEAKKIYNQNGAPVEFLCSGEVGGIDTDGSIPFIRIKSDGTMTSSDKGLSFINTVVDIEGKININNNDIITYNTNMVILSGTEISGRGLTVDRSSFKAFFGGNKITFGHITVFNGYVDIEGTDTAATELNLVGATNVGYLMSATRSSYVLLAKNLSIFYTGTASQHTSVEASHGSTLHFDSVKKIAFNSNYISGEKNYDLHARVNATIVLDICEDVSGTSIPDFFMAADHLSKIICYQSKVTRTVAEYGLSSITGSTISITGDQTNIRLTGPGSTFGVGILASNGNVNLSGITSVNPMITLEGFNIGIYASQGGIINAMSRINRDTNIAQSNIPLAIAEPSKTGAVIYDSDIED